MPSDPKRVKEIFLEAAERTDEADRAAYLDRACGGDAGLRARVETLLRSHDPDGSFLGTPAAVAPDPDHAGTMVFTPTPEPEHPDTGTSGSAEDDEGPLGFLAPSERPDSLGRIGHYEVLQVLGKGGFGTVFRAFDEVLHRVVAVKVMAPQMAATSPARKRFLREARTSAQVRHENVVQVYEVGEAPLPYLVMEFIPGETLQHRLDRVGPIDAAEVVRIGRQIAEGLAAAHATDLIHRDIKPGNILLEGAQLRVKITDFGLARAADDASISQSGIIAGTPMYMAPEQALGHKLDQRADLFSLGSVLYQMVAGRPPFRANGTLAVLKRVAEDTPRDIREITPETPQWLCDIITKLHAKNPDGRYQSAREVADVLADCDAQLKANSRLKDFSRIPRSTPAATGKSGRRKWVAAAAVLLLPVIALAVTELAGVTHLVRGEQSTTVSIKPGSDQAPVVVANQEPPTPVAKQAPLPPPFKNSIGMEFVVVPKGRSWLGGGKDKLGDKELEIKDDFYLGKYEVTQEEWEKVMGENPSQFSRTGESKDRVENILTADLKRFPVENVTWDQCQFFVAKLNQREKMTGWIYRLPTEAEWEYACRGGPMAEKLDSAFDYYFAKPTNTLQPEQANFNKGLYRTTKVGSYEANALGLHDMHGNAWEWCEDNKQTGRGGGWISLANHVRAGYRHVAKPSDKGSSIGLRLARVPSGAPSPEVKTLPTALAPFPDTEVQRITGLPAGEQVEEVRKALRVRNPEFDGTLYPTYDGDVVVGLRFSTERVKDLSPVRALTKLTKLEASGPEERRGVLTDLSVLKGLPLGELVVPHNAISDLSPLKGMSIHSLFLDRNPIKDFSPLQDLPLRKLLINKVSLDTLKPLEGLKLEHLDCIGLPITDLSPLKGMPLKSLMLYHTNVSDLTPLTGMKLEYLNLHGTKVSDLSPLQGMPLTDLHVGETQVTDISPLKESPLKKLFGDFRRDRDFPILREIKTLEIINNQPAVEFLK